MAVEKQSYYDLWQSNTSLKSTAVLHPELEDYNLRQVKKNFPKKCAAKTRGSMRVGDAVDRPHPGSSYNPAMDDHELLLVQAAEMEKRKEKMERRLERQVKLPPPEELVTPEIKLKESMEGLERESEDEEETDETVKVEDAVYQPVPAPIIAENRKPLKLRKRAQLRNEQARKRRDEKLDRIRQSEVYRIRSIKKEIKKREEERSKEKERKERRKANLAKIMPPKLGSARYEPPEPELQLSTELRGSLMELKPEGSLLEDRYKSLQKRGIVEPRTKQKRNRKYKLKKYEKRSHRDMPQGYLPR